MSQTVTVISRGKRYLCSFSQIPGRSFGPYSFAEMIRDLRMSSGLDPLVARDLVLDAFANGSATTKMEFAR